MGSGRYRYGWGVWDMDREGMAYFLICGLGTICNKGKK